MKLVKLLLSLCALLAFTFCSKDDYKLKNGVNTNEKVSFNVYKIDAATAGTKTRSAVIDMLSEEGGEPLTATCVEPLADGWCAVGYHGHNKTAKGAVGIYAVTDNGPVLKYIISTDEARINFIETSSSAGAAFDKLYFGLDAVKGEEGRVGIAEIDMSTVRTSEGSPVISKTVTFPGLSINSIGIRKPSKEMDIAFAPFGDGTSGLAQIKLDGNFSMSSTVHFRVDPLFAQVGRSVRCYGDWMLAAYWADKNDIAHSYVDFYRYDETKFSAPTFGNDEPLLRIDLWEGETPAAIPSNKCCISSNAKPGGRTFFFVGYDKFRIYSIPSGKIQRNVKDSEIHDLLTLDYSEDKMVHTIFESGAGYDLYVGYTNKLVKYEFNTIKRILTTKAEFSLHNGASLNYCHVSGNKVLVAYGTSGLVVLDANTLERIGE